MESTDGFDATSWSWCHDPWRSRVSAGLTFGDRQRAGANKRARWAIRAQLPPVEKRSGESAEGVATLHARTVAGAGGIRLAGGSSVESVPAGLLPIRRAGEFDCDGRSGGASEHEGDGLAHGFNSISFGIPTVDFEWPARIRPAGPVDGSAGGQPGCDGRELQGDCKRKHFGERSIGGGAGQSGTYDVGADSPVDGNRAHFPAFIGAGLVGSAAGGFEKFAEAFRSVPNSSQLAGGGGEPGGSAQEPGTSEESGGDKENRNAGSRVSQFECQDIVFGERAR